MLSIKEVKDEIVERLGAIESGGDSLFAGVYGYPPKEISESPLAIVRFTGTESEFATSADNERADSYTIMVLIPLELGDDKLTIEDATNGVEDCLQAIIDLFDGSQDFDGKVLYINAADISSVDILPLNNGLNMAGSVKLVVRKLKYVKGAN